MRPNTGLQRPEEATNWLAAIVSSSTDAIVGKTGDGVVTSFNPAAESLFGYRLEEIIGKPVRILIPPGRQEEEDRILARIAAGERVEHYDTIRLHKNGSPIDVSVSVSPVLDGRGGIIGAAKIARDISGRRRAEEALRESERRQLRQLATFNEAALKSLGEGLYAIDTQGLVTFMNPAAEELFGWSFAGLRGKKMHDMTHHHYRDGRPFPSCECDGFQVLMHGKPLKDHEDVFIRKDGTFFDVIYTITPLRDHGGQITGLIVVFSDITERKRAEEALRGSELRYRRLVEQMTDGIFVASPDGRYIDVNPAGCAMLGMTREEVLASTFLDVLDPAQIEKLPGKIASLAEGKIQCDEWRFRRKDGSVFTGELMGRQLPDGCFQGVLRDITERKRTEAALRESEQQFRSLADAIPQLAWMANADGWISWYNRRWYEYTGTTPGQMEGWGWQSVHNPETLPAVLERWKASIATGEPFDMIFPLRGADGLFRPFLTRIQPLKNAEGRVVRWFGTNTDVDELKRSEEALRESEERLSAIVRTAVDAIIVIDEKGIIQSINPATERLFGYAPSELAGKNVSMLMPEPDRSLHGTYISAYLRTGKRKIIGIGREVRARRKDGSLRAADLSVAEWQAGGKRFFTGIVRDITERKRREEKIQLLLREVNHRSKNMLGVVQAIASQTLALGCEDFIARFSERVQALAANQDLLVKSQWQGVELGDLVRAQLAHFEGVIGSRIDIAGPPLHIAAESAQPIAMALHELAANAGKYGALSNERGKVSIAWDIARDETFHLSWMESGGPIVVSPTRQGFGTTVIAHVPEAQLGAGVTLDYPPGGVTWRLACPAANVIEPDGAGADGWVTD
ncbi:MAG: PAS domain S-box protein [Rhodomicrobium sp.]